VATDALAPGDYTIHCGVKQGAKGKEGLKPGESATSEAHFTVKPFETPTVSCMADPVTIKPGETSTITAKAASPQNRPRSFSYEAQAGAISGTGSTVEFNSAGAPTGVVGVTCKVTDDKGQQAMAATSVTIVQPYVPPAPHTEALCSQSFAKDAKRPASVDNEAKACLDQVALALEKQADARAAVVGHSDAEEQAVMAHEAKLAAHNRHVQVHDLAAERAVNAKDYLVKEKGIDAARITPATSAAEGQTAEDYLVPAGANFAGDVSGTTAVDENAVRPILEPAPRHVAKKAAKQP
jgi:outer membrane protein OmpA-like peptidoglycan-associated protein